MAALTDEPMTERVQAFLDRQPAGAVTLSDWCVTEVSSALTLKKRTAQLTSTEWSAALSLFSRMAADQVAILSVSRSHFAAAARYCVQPGLDVRAGDALHLAVCRDAGQTLVTLDRRMRNAAVAIGVDVADV